MAALSWQELDRARSHALPITQLLTGANPVRRSGGNWIFPGGLAIHMATGMWFDPKAGKGGRSTVELWCHLKGCGKAEAVRSIKLFLSKNPGYGPSSGDYADDDGEDADADDPYTLARLADAQEWWALRQPIDGTPGAAWIARRLPGHGPLNPDDVAWLAPNVAHAGNGAVLFTLRCLGVIVGYELHLIDPVRCARSKIKHPRRLCWLERGRRKGPVTFAAFDPPMVQNGKQTVAFCEGWFDQQSIRLALPNLTAIGVPGVHWLKRQQLTKGSTVHLFRDGDIAGSPADKLLIGAADHFLLQPDVTVFITYPGQKDDGTKKDTNDILLEGGIDAVKQLHDDALLYNELSFDGRIIQIARLKDEKERDEARQKLWEDYKKQGIRKPTIDRLVKEERARLGLEAAADAAGTIDDAIPEWFGVIDLAAALQSCADYLDTQVLLPESYRHLAALFVVFTQLCRQGKGHIKTCFHLNPASSEPGAGKTELAAAMHEVTAGSLMPKEGYTRATIQQDVMASLEGGNPNPVLILDEADQQIVGGIVVYINGTTRRGVGFDWNIQQADGRWKKVTLNIFSPAIICGIGDLPKTVASRVATMFMRPPTAGEVEAWQLSHGALLGDTATAEELRQETERLEKLEEAALLVKAHIHAWVAQYDERLLTPRLPTYLHGELARQGKTLLQLLAIANLAGGDWPDRFEAAVRLMFSVEHEATVLARLLTSIRQAFHDQPEEPDRGNGRSDRRLANSRDRITLPELIKYLAGEPHEDWSRLDARGELTWRWIATKLLNELDPPGTFEWKVGPHGPGRKKHTGYYARQFEQAWKRHRIPEPVDPDSDGRDFETWEQQQQPDGMSFSSRESGAGDPSDPRDRNGNRDGTPRSPGSPVPDSLEENHIPEDADDLVATILALRRANPTKQLPWLAKQVRQSQARVKAILEAEDKTL